MPSHSLFQSAEVVGHFRDTKHGCQFGIGLGHGVIVQVAELYPGMLRLAAQGCCIRAETDKEQKVQGDFRLFITARIGVAGFAQMPPELAGQSGFFLQLAHRRLQRHFTAFHLAAGI